MPEVRKHPVVTPEQATQTPYPYVYVNYNGTVRELHKDEREYLEQAFSPFDGGRPYVKTSFEAKDGCGCISGFCHRSEIPPHIAIGDVIPPMSLKGHLATARKPVRRKPWWKFW
ncbi:MAG: hypothetical protein ABFD92_05995 [Planctomycetaceae bacterium]|nr:hypothetical protein [Planctomycetaceae bacterium]